MLARVICVLAVSSSSALQIGAPQGRRAFLSQLAAAGTLAASPLAAQAISARTGLSSPFTGEYDDKNHPGCLRSMCGMFEVHHLASATAPPRVRALGFACTGGAPPQAFQLAWHRCQLRPRSLTSQLPTIRREGGGREARRLHRRRHGSHRACTRLSRGAHQYIIRPKTTAKSRCCMPSVNNH